MSRKLCIWMRLITTRIWHWKSHWKTRVTLKIERTKNISNADNVQWDYKGLTIVDKFQCDKRDTFSVIIFCKAFHEGFSSVSVWLDFSVWFSVSCSHKMKAKPWWKATQSDENQSLRVGRPLGVCPALTVHLFIGVTYVLENNFLNIRHHHPTWQSAQWTD